MTPAKHEFTEGELAIIRETVRVVIAENEHITDKKIEYHRMSCANSKYNKVMSLIVAFLTSVGVAIASKKFFN